MSKKQDSGFIPLDTIVMLEKKFYEENPKIYKASKCYVDDPEGDDTCVWDYDMPMDCTYAEDGVKKEKCKYWVEREFENNLTAADVWAWLLKQV